MAVPVILRGDDTAFRGTSLSVVLPEGDYAGLRVRFQLLGIVREWDSPASGAELAIDLAAGETASLPLGTHFARIDVANYAGAGYVVSDTIRVRVTDDVADATGADNAIHVQPGGGGGFSPDLDGIDGDPATPDALKGAFSLLLERLRAAAGVFALLALASLSCGLLRADGLEVQTAPLGGLPWATPVVTNVTGTSGITTNDVRAIVAEETEGVVRYEDGGGLHASYFDATGDVNASGIHAGAIDTGGGIDAAKLSQRKWEYRPREDMEGDREVSTRYDIESSAAASTNYTDAAIAAATNNLPQPTPGDPYATRPWWISADPVPLATPSTTITNGDAWAWVQGASDGMGARLSLVTEDRPTAYAYDPPGGEWTVSGGTLDASNLVVTPTQDVVRASYLADDGTARSVSLNLTAAVPGSAGGIDGTVAGTWRDRCASALLSAFAAGTNSAPAEYDWCRASVFGAYTSWVTRAAYQRYGDGSGDWYGVPTSANAGFFWPALGANLAPFTAPKGDKPGTWSDSQVIVVSPHYAIGAAHAGHFGGVVVTNLSPFRTMRNSVAHGVLADNGKSYYYGIPTSISPSKVGDAQVVRFRDAFPSNCIARLADAATLAALSPTFPVRWPAFQTSQHQTVTPCAVSRTTTNTAGVVTCIISDGWAYQGFDGLEAFKHRVHIYDSSCLVGAAGPSGQLIPLFLFHMASSTMANGPALFGGQVDAIDAIIRADSDGAECVWRWTPEELQ